MRRFSGLPSSSSLFLFFLFLHPPSIPVSSNQNIELASKPRRPPPAYFQVEVLMDVLVFRTAPLSFPPGNCFIFFFPSRGFFFLVKQCSMLLPFHLENLFHSRLPILGLDLPVNLSLFIFCMSLLPPQREESVFLAERLSYLISA